MTNSELKAKLSKPTEFFKQELSQIRTGRASPALVEAASIEAYGSHMTLRELGSITVLDPQNLVVVPWDKSLKNSIIKGIRDSGLGLNPVEDGERLRVPIPALTEERRKEFTKMVAAKAEEAKNVVRNIRQDAMILTRALLTKKLAKTISLDLKKKLRK
jgi:ribosome recycling factor